MLGSVAPSPPTPLPRFTGARGGLVVSGQLSVVSGQVSRGRESAGVAM